MNVTDKALHDANAVERMRVEQMARKLAELYWQWVDAGRPRREVAS